jgi:methylenetetrahydrofolate reductase (NADPH)
LTDEPTPVDLERNLAAASDEAAQTAIGLAHATVLGNAVLEGGASGLHLYTFNQHEAVLEVLQGVGILADIQKEHA